MKFISQIKKTYRVVKNRAGIGKRRAGVWMLRPFREKDLRTPPDDWKVGPPDFVGIASGKAGTSWWYYLLLRHPSIKQNLLRKKELQYFCHFGPGEFDEGAIHTYRKAFASPKDSISGEWSPIYLNYPFAMQHLAEAAPETKLLAVIRNPVDRVLSMTNHILSNRLRDMDLKPQQAYVYRIFDIVPGVFYQTMVADAFRHVLDLFGREKLLVLQYEKCKLRPKDELRRTYQFLGVDDSFVPDTLNRQVNVQPYRIEPFRTDQRAQVAEFFMDDVRSLIRLFPDFDLSLWPDFSGV
jgi:sulfotransferase family protein